MDVKTYFGIDAVGASKIYGIIAPLLFTTISYWDYRYYRNVSVDELQVYANGAWVYSLGWFLFSSVWFWQKNKWMRFLNF